MPNAWLAVALLLGSAPGPAQFAGETLRYSVNWPSGLSLGEAEFTAQRAEPAGNWELAFQLDAAVPGFQASDRIRSVAGAGFCSLESEKNFTHGKRKAAERTVFDQQRGQAVRTTLAGGGKSELPLSACAKDALAFLYFLRAELAQGRVPSAQNVYFGAPYRVRLDYAGTQNLRVGDSRAEADRIVVSLKGPASETTFEIFFARDAVRTPLVIKAPLPLGTFSMELVR